MARSGVDPPRGDSVGNSVADCVFCGIVAQPEDRAVLQDDVALAFLDHRPLRPGHCLLVPRRHVATLADLPAALVGPYFRAAQTLARAVEAAMEADGSFVAINNRVSQSVPHLHVHVVPRTKGDGLRGFFWPRTTYASEAESADYAARLAGALAPPAAPVDV
jgi:histidine triad (HIT) family protein